MTAHLVAVTLDDSGLAPPGPDLDQERKVAIFDLLEGNAFDLPRSPVPGPFALTLGLREGRLVFALADEAGAKAGEFHLSLGPFRQVVKDYLQICESYYEAVRHMPPARIEAIDMARRGIHNEGARVLMERLAGKAQVDQPTARLLFTLIVTLIGG